MNNVDFTNFLNSILTSVTTTQVLSMLASVIGVGMTFFLMWFGVKKIVPQFTEMVSFGRIALSGDSGRIKEWYREQNLKQNGWTKESLKEALKTNSAFSEATMGTYDKPMEPVEPHPERITPQQRKETNNWYAAHDMFGHELGYDKRQWENYYKKNANKYKKKYNNYKKKNYYYDSYGNKYYK